MRSRPCFTLLLSLALSASPALADDEADAQAAVLFEDGRALMKDGRFAEACPKLEQSQRLSPHGGTLLNLAVCHERVGAIATAWTEFQSALTAARTEGKDDRARLAGERIEVLQPRLPWLTVDVPREASEGLRVELDGSEIVAFAWGKEMPLDPGEHRVVAMAPGRPTWEQRFRIAEGEHRTIALQIAAPAPAPLPAVASAAASPARVPPPVAAPTRPSRHRIVFEAGLFAGLLHGDVAAVQSDDDGSIYVEDQAGYLTTCANAGCDYQLGELESLAAGGTGFLGYSVTERLHVGFRALGGLRLGGGFVVAAGPAVSARVLGPIWVGAGFVVGDLLVRDEGSVSPQGGYRLTSSSSQSVWSTTGLTVGNSLEVGIAVLETESGALFVQSTPMFLLGSKDIAVVVPAGLAYRFF